MAAAPADIAIAAADDDDDDDDEDDTDIDEPFDTIEELDAEFSNMGALLDALKRMGGGPL